MNIVTLILDDCSDEEKELIAPLLDLNPSRVDVPLPVPTEPIIRNPFLECIEKAKADEACHYERLADARKRFFALHPECVDVGVTYFKGWWDAQGFGGVAFQDVPQYRFRGQDLEISNVLVAKDRAFFRKRALDKRQEKWNRMQRDMRSEWMSSLTRGVKSG